MLPIVVIAALLAPAQADAAPLEIDILEEYLALHDALPDQPHCQRHHGFHQTPAGMMRIPGTATNRILEEHLAFHVEMGDQPGSGFAPSPDDADRYGIVFLEWHRHFLSRYEDWRAENGHPPLEPWDPGTPMPPDLAYPYPERACNDGRDSDPRVALPSWATVEGGDVGDPIFGHLRLCDFADLNQFGKSIAIEYHWQFHAGIKGDMVGGRGPLDPAFWAGHQFINRLMDTWWDACEASTPPGTMGAPLPEAPIPAPALAPLAIAVAALVARRRGRK